METAILVFVWLICLIFSCVSLAGFVLGILAFAETKQAIHLVMTILFPFVGIYFYCKHCRRRNSES